MRSWIQMVSCSESEFNGLHEELRNCGGLYIIDNVLMPETFARCECNIEFRYYSDKRITLTCVPKPPKYTGKNKRIRTWAETGYVEFSSFNDLKKFLKSFTEDTNSDLPAHTPIFQSENNRSDTTSPKAENSSPPPQPKMQYDRENLTVPDASKSYIVIDKDAVIVDLKDEIYGQDENIEKIVHLVCNHLSTKRKLRPLSIFIYGSTGTGKSKLVECLVDAINSKLQQKDRLAYRPIDCTQFQERSDISKLTGAAPGYVGFDEPGVFSILEDNLKTVFVFEEIEKAAGNVTDVIMQAMETGRQETNGKTLRNGQSFYDLSSCVIFFTSNINIEEKKNIGFATQNSEHIEQPAKVKSNNIARLIGEETKEAKAKLAESGKFRREVIGRMNAIIKFNPLTGDVVKDIAAKCIRDTAAKSHLLYITEIDTPIMQEFINATAGEVEAFGVRSLRNEAEYYFNDPFREFSHTHEDYAEIKVSGSLDNILITLSGTNTEST